MTQLSSLQLSNVGAVIALLTSVPDTDYNHAHFGQSRWDSDPNNPNAVCAVGHAFKNPGKFRVEAENPNFFQRLLGIKTTKPDTSHRAPRNFAYDVFGRDLWHHAFASHAYGMYAESVTKNMVLNRLYEVKASGMVPEAA